MDIKPQRPKGRTGAVSSLNVAIEAMNLAKEVSSITPAKAVFGSVSVLLTMLKVRFLLFHYGVTQVHNRPGLDGQRTGLRRTRIILRRYLQSPRPGGEWETIGRVQQVYV